MRSLTASPAPVAQHEPMTDDKRTGASIEGRYNSGKPHVEGAAGTGDELQLDSIGFAAPLRQAYRTSGLN